LPSGEAFARERGPTPRKDSAGSVH